MIARRAGFAGTALAALLASGAARAQAVPPEPEGHPKASGGAVAAPPSAAGEIVVTAQRRSERLENVPISIATASSADIQLTGGASIDNLTKITPGVYLQNNTFGLSPTIRGIGSTLATSAGEQNVAIYVDNIYYAVPSGNIFDLASVSGIEILKGPQGTLFGRNATGGAILIHTKDPTFSQAGSFNVSYERFDQVRTNAYLNEPLGDVVAVNASVAYRYSRGYIRDLLSDDITNQGHSFTARGKILIQPSDKFSLVFTAAHADFSDPTGNVIRNLQPAPLLALLGAGPIASDRYHSSAGPTQLFIKTSTDEYSARAKLDVWGGTLSSYTAYIDNTLNSLVGVTGSYYLQNVAIGVRTNTFSQEVNYASAPDRPLAYVAGIYYFRSRIRVPFLTVNDEPLSNSAAQNDALAGYLDGTYKTGRLTIIAGVRYSNERRKAEFANGVSAPSPFTRFQATTDRQWTPRFGLQYAVGPRSNIYATYSRGFKSGVFDVSSPDGPGVSPEKINAYEIGFKTASRSINFNAAAFYYDYLDMQVNANISGSGGQGSVRSELFNVPKSRIYGAEADATFRLLDDFDIKAALAYTHTRYVNFTTAPGYTGDPANPATLGGLIYASIPVDASGREMVRAPKITASATVRYHRQLDEKHEMEVALSPYYSSRVFFTFLNDQSQKPYLTLDANVSLTIDEKVKVSMFGHNLTDTTYVTNIGQSALGLNESVFATPRTYGVSFGYQF